MNLFQPKCVLCSRFVGNCNIYCPLTVRGCRPGKTVQMTEQEVRGLCMKSRELFLSQPILLELEAPLKICGKMRICPLDCWCVFKDLVVSHEWQTGEWLKKPFLSLTGLMLSEAHLKLCDLSHQYLLFIIYFDTYMSKYKLCVVIG